MKREAQTLKRFLSLALALLMVFSMIPQITIGAKAAETPTTLYLKPNSNWLIDNARFAAYFFGNGEKWVSMTDADGDGVYEVAVPSGYPSVIFCRMNPSATANNWDNRWNQTADLSVPTDGTDYYTVKADTWDKGGGTWATRAYTVSGSAGLCGAAWEITSENVMTMNENGLYEIVYENVNSSTTAYEFKVTDGTWNNAWPDDNYSLSVNEDGSTVTITFNASTKEVKADVVAPVKEYTVNLSLTNLTKTTGAETATEGEDYTASFSANDGYTLPETIEVKVGETVITDYTYANGTVTILASAVTGDITITAAGVEVKTTKTVYFQNNWKWTDVKIHYWGENDSTEWPGVAMTLLENDGTYDIYYAEIPADTTGMIFNGIKNDGSGNRDQSPNITDVQAAPLCYYMAWEDANVVGTFAYQSNAGSGNEGDEDDTPTEATYIVAGTAGLCGTTWDVGNADNKMTLGEDGLYSITYENVAAGTHSFKVTDGSWNNSWGGTGTDGNYEITLDEISNVTITFNAETKEIKVGRKAAEDEGGNDGGESTSITVYCINSAEWAAVYAYAWNSAGNNSWPGVSMTKTEDTVNSFDVYSVTFDTAYENVIFNNNNGSQTADLTMQSGQYYDVKTNAWYESLDKVPALDPLATDCYLVGSFNGWNTTVNEFKLNAEGEKVGCVSIELEANTTYEFKVMKDGGWTGCATTITATTSDLAFSSSVNDNAKITTGAAGTYTFAYSVTDGKLSVTYPSAGGEGEGDETEKVTYTAIFHFANTLGWGSVNLHTWGAYSTGNWPGIAVSQDADGFYTATLTYKAPANQGLNFIFNGGGAQTVDLALDDAAFTKGEDGIYTAEKWVVLTTTNDEGKYYADIRDDGNGIAISPKVNGTSVTFEYLAADANSVEVRGTFNEWVENTTKMEKDAHGVWSVTVENLTPGIHEYKFVVDGKWHTDPTNTWIQNDNSAFLILDPNAKDKNEITINVYYERADGIYSTTVDGAEAKWNAYIWGDSFGGKRYDFEEDENGKMVTTITVTGRETQEVALKTRLSTKTKEWVKEESQVTIALNDITSGTIDVFVKSDCSGGNAGTLSYTTVLNTDVTKANKISDLQFNYEDKTVAVTTLKAIEGNPKDALVIKNTVNESDTIAVVSISSSGNTYTLTLNKTLDLVYLYQYKITFDGYEYDIDIDNVYATDKFAEEFTYEGDDLGATYTSDSTKFVLWAPTAEAVSVKLYATGSDAETGAADLGAHAMTKDVNGTWIVEITGDLKNVYYTYAVTVDGETVEAVDPYARTTGVNGNRGMVIDLDSTDPADGWSEITNKPASYTDAVIYELHVRDFSIDDSSGVKDDWQGKFLGLTQTGTTTANGVSTGLDYLKDLGITHLHLLPIYDYASVDETKCDTFNWGYDPQNYNTPEGSYSTDPYNGEVRVKEMKEMVDTLHENEIGVIMDVVYNHVYDASTFCFNNIVPGYFSRVNSNRSGCGNDTASEREMVRKYIVESVLYWAEEYHIDGFRFDLVGLLDTVTINQIVTEVHKVRPDVIFYGEGWDMDDTNKEPGTEMAKQGNASKTPGFAYFSDNFRDEVGAKKEWDNSVSLGFVSGKQNAEGSVVSNFMANPWWTNNPQQVIQYISCHDNYTMVDKLVIAKGKTQIDDEIIKMNNLAAAVYMTAQGVPFIHAGEEILREKLEEDGGRCENSYNASDYVNHIEWSDLENKTYAANSAYYKGLIAFRQEHPALRMTNAGTVKSAIQSVIPQENVVAFLIDGSYSGDQDDICVIFNANSNPVVVTLPEGVWSVCIDGENAGTKTLYTAEVSVLVDGLSAMVLTCKDEGKNSGDVNQADESKYQVGTYSMAADAEEDTVTVYFSNNMYWNQVYIHYWGGSQVTEWPGKAMTFVETNDYGEDIYSCAVPADTTGIIINNGADEQTVDITDIVDGQGYYCTNKGGNSSFNNDGVYSATDGYYLFGYINGMNYACEDSSAAMGKYKFVDGKVTVNFETDSYVGVKTAGNKIWYMTDGWLGNVSSATLYDTSNLDSDANKLMIPGGMDVTLTLSVNEDGTATLSYVTDNSSAFKDESGIQDGVTLHCWNWSFEEIEKNMATIAAQGYTAIQTSPVQVMKEATNLSTNSVDSHWWVYYQPVDFKITTDDGNALGTKSELESMIETAHKYGIKVIVDVVANHLGNKTRNDLADAIPEYLRKSEYWHDIKTDITNWNDRYDMTQHCLTGLPDLNTANDDIQSYVLDFLKECVDIGVDGFRFDMAKSIETPDDNAAFASDFWPTVVGGIQKYAGNDLYIYGEVLDNPAIAVSAYTEYMSVTDNSWGNDLRGKVSSGTASMAAGYHKAADASNLVIWAESHDTFADNTSSGVSEANINKTWALVAARADAMGLYLARPAELTQALGVASITGWANDEVAAVNKFHNAFVGQSETIGNSGKISYVVRGTSGVVLVNTKGTTADVNIAVTMSDGKYVDHITGNVFTVESGTISGKIGDTGIAVVYGTDLTTSNMTLGNDLGLNLWVNKGDLVEDETYYATVVRTRYNAQGEAVEKTETIPMTDWVNKGTYYQIPYEFSAKEMNDKVVFQIYNSKDNAISDKFEDSVVEYAKYMLDRYDQGLESKKLATTLVDMLNYGAAAQKEFGYNTNNLANSFLTEEQQDLATKEIPELKDVWKGNGIGYGSNLELKDNIILNIWFKNAGVESVKISYTNHYGKLLTTTVNKADFTNRGIPGVSSVAVDKLFNEDNAVEELVVADGGQKITCTFYGEADAKGEPIGVVTESIESYLAYMLNKDTKSSGLYEAIAKFIDSSHKYFHN